MGQIIRWAGRVGVLVALGLFYVWQQVQTRDLERDILRLEERKAVLAYENARLLVDISRQSGQEEVAPVAMSMLNLDYPMVGQVIVLSEKQAEIAGTTRLDLAVRAKPEKAKSVTPIAAMPMGPVGKR
jgi:hypothetical protein